MKKILTVPRSQLNKCLRNPPQSKPSRNGAIPYFPTIFYFSRLFPFMSFSLLHSLLGLPQLRQAITMDVQDGTVSKPVAVISCIAMALLYVVTLYAPTVLLRLPPPSSFTNYMIRRFLCAIVSTTLSLFISPLILPVRMLLLSPPLFLISTCHFCTN